MTKTFEQAIAEAQDRFNQDCQAIVEQYRKYPNGFTFTTHLGKCIVKKAVPHLYGDRDQMKTYQVSIVYDVEALDFTFQDLTKKSKKARSPKPVQTSSTEYELDIFLEKLEDSADDHTT